MGGELPDASKGAAAPVASEDTVTLRFARKNLAVLRWVRQAGRPYNRLTPHSYPSPRPRSKVHMKMGDAVSALTALQMAQAVQARILALARRDGGAGAAASLESERFAAAGE